MHACLPTHSDAATYQDELDRAKLVQQIAREIAWSKPPLVFGIHGDWGSGKTSLLYQLEHELTGECKDFPEAKEMRRICDINNVFVVWFEAWRYQHEPAPVVALLQEICRQLPKYQKIKGNIKKWTTIVTKGFSGAIDEVSLELEAAPLGVGGKTGFKFKNPAVTVSEAADEWHEDRLSSRLTTDHVRELLKGAIQQLLGKEKDHRVCVLIDDLDRCHPAAALRLLEGIKIHLSLPQCTFVLGINVHQIEQAIAPLLPGAKDETNKAEKQAEAAEYLEKLCTFTWKLPFPAPGRRAALLRVWLSDPPGSNAKQCTPLSENLRTKIAATASEFDCLPGNPRKIKALANTIRQLAARAMAFEANVKAGESLPLADNEADALLIGGSIYQFHPELLRFLQSSKNAWIELVNWAAGKSSLPQNSDLRKLFDVLRLTSATVADDKNATPGSSPRVALFADPTHLNVFRIQDLLRDACDPSKRNSVSYAGMQRYLDLPS